MSPPRMRTAEGLLEIIKQQDPDTAITLRAIRRMIATGEIPHVPVGCKKLVNVDLFFSHLSAGAV